MRTTNRTRPPCPVVSADDAYYLKAETPTSSARWSLAITFADDGSGPLELEDLRSHVAARLPSVPWMSWRMHGRGARPARYRWLETSPLPLDRLVLHEALPAGGSVESYLAALLFEDLGFDLPMWRIRLLDGEAGAQHVVLDGHHAAGGGYVFVDMLQKLFSAGQPPPRPAPVHLAHRVPWRSEALDVAMTGAALVRRAVVAALPSPRWEPARSGPPLVGHLSRGRRVVGREVSLERVQAIAAAHGASATRVIAALVATALDELVPDPSVASLRAVFPRATKVGEVDGQGNASRSSFLDLPLHLAPRDRLAALKDSFARSATVADPRPAEADLVLSLVQPLGEYVYRGRPAVSVVAGAPLRTCSRPVTRLTVIVLYHGPSLFFSITADEASLGERAPGFGDALVRAVETFEAELAASR